MATVAAADEHESKEVHALAQTLYTHSAQVSEDLAQSALSNIQCAKPFSVLLLRRPGGSSSWWIRWITWHSKTILRNQSQVYKSTHPLCCNVRPSFHDCKDVSHLAGAMRAGPEQGRLSLAPPAASDPLGCATAQQGPVTQEVVVESMVIFMDACATIPLLKIAVTCYDRPAICTQAQSLEHTHGLGVAL
ncbi:hypothetical protein IE81DRAFT_329167 [Ceraceosorus guamensis]|uniref:Uncharacterized protein n=1 Tax=Ceraceosorus guamensis TaxID=1522189 RepID=A0A316W4E9_9BASI|nr:hypothetical protein IE81DRAFT_329167 [Ceraceosorus guamensis]PWN43998.1 hypothetical protein IE81DRAFT_329167 [Ceraceosorus guamensis]